MKLVSPPVAAELLRAEQRVQPAIVYTRQQLLDLAVFPRAAGMRHDIPVDLLRRRRRGTRAGVKRNRRQRERVWRETFRPALPSVIIGNIRSICNKTEELETLVRSQKVYRECSLMFLTETWLTDCIPDSSCNFNGFLTIRADRDPKESGKRRGGGLALLVNNRWCNPAHVTIKERICNRDIELLAASLRPFYLPREFTVVVAIVVYISPSAHAETACEIIHAAIARLQARYPDGLILLSGDFNHTSLSNTLPSFTQFVDCPTRGDKTLDLLYANVGDAYKCSELPPLGASDHNLVHLSPIYTPVVKRLPVTTRTVKCWSGEAEESLQDCLELTDWDVFCESYGDDIEGLTDCISDYIRFCVDINVPSREIQCFPNNKPWVTSSLKGLLNEKKRAFREGDRVKAKALQKELRVKIAEGKQAYRQKLEDQLQQDGVKQVWSGMRKITGMERKGGPLPDGDKDLADGMNVFFNRFDSSTPSSQLPAVLVSSNSVFPYYPPTPPPPSHHSKANHSLTPIHPASLEQSPPPTSFTLHHSQQSLPHLPPSPSSLPSSRSTSVSPLTLLPFQVKRELDRLKQGKAAGPDGISPRLLKSCSSQLCEILTYLFNLSLNLQKIPTLWKTSCLVPVPKKRHPADSSDYRPVALTSHIMKALERLVLSYLRPRVRTYMDPLQFAYQPNIGVDDALIYMLQRAYGHLDTSDATVRIMFFDFSSAFNTIQPMLLGEKMRMMQVESALTSWVMDYLTCRPQYVRLRNCTSSKLLSSTGAPQGTVLSPFLFTIYTSDFQYNSDSCFLQKFSDDSAVVGCIREGREEEYRGMIGDFVDWCNLNHLQLNTSKTKEMVVDFRRKKTSPAPITILGSEVEVVSNYRYLGVQLDDKLDWSSHLNAVYKKGQCRLYFLRRLRSFNICRPLLCTFYQTVVASALFFGVVCWGEGARLKDRNRLNKLIKKASSVIGAELESVQQVSGVRMLRKLNSIRRNDSHPLHHLQVLQQSSFSHRLIISSQSRPERSRRSFLPAAIRLHQQQETLRWCNNI